VNKLDRATLGIVTKMSYSTGFERSDAINYE